MVIDKGMMVRVAIFRGIILLHVAHMRSVKAAFASRLFIKKYSRIKSNFHIILTQSFILINRIQR